MRRHSILALVALHCLATGILAQTNGTNSPYSRFGLGRLADQSQGYNKSMGGLAQGIRDGRRINMQNPASYAAIDSLSFIFDVGMTFQNGNFKTGGKSINAHNTTLDYFNAAFRLAPRLGCSFGFMPYSSIGYNYSESKYLTDHFSSGSNMTYTNQYSGDGGLHSVYLGIGWNPLAQLSIGVNAGYMWGNYEQNTTQTFYDAGAATSSSNGLRSQTTANLSTWKVDVGVQYPIQLTKDHQLTIGATYGIGHAINSTAHYNRFMANSDTLSKSVSKAFDLPHTIAAGAVWTYKEQWRVGVDVSHQRWGNAHMAQLINEEFTSSTQNYMNRTGVTVGAEYQPDRYSPRYLRRVQYRIGASMATPYYKVNGHNGPTEYGLSAGFSLPVSNNPNSKSLVHVALQWLKESPSAATLITENYLRLHIGITFNERWFMKWKIQ